MDEGRRGSMLLDNDRDPLEFKNLAEDPQYAGIATQMQKLLAQLPGRTH